MKAGIPQREIDRMDLLRYLDTLFREVAQVEDTAFEREGGTVFRRGFIDDVLG